MDGIEATYYRRIKEYLRAYRDELKRKVTAAVPHLVTSLKHVTPEAIRTDDAFDDLNRIFGSVDFELGQSFSTTDLEALARRTGQSVSDLTRKSTERQWKRVLGLDLLTSDAGIKDFLNLISKQNAQLIKSIPDRRLPTMQAGILQALQRGDRVEEIAKYIDETFELMDGNAATIARTEINKLHGQLSSYQQQEVGVEKYTWATAQDERVRPSHADLNGQVFTWDVNDEPALGADGGPIIPGQEINCRCVSIPVFDTAAPDITKE